MLTKQKQDYQVTCNQRYIIFRNPEHVSGVDLPACSRVFQKGQVQVGYPQIQLFLVNTFIFFRFKFLVRSVPYFTYLFSFFFIGARLFTIVQLSFLLETEERFVVCAFLAHLEESATLEFLGSIFAFSRISYCLYPALKRAANFHLLELH